MGELGSEEIRGVVVGFPRFSRTFTGDPEVEQVFGRIAPMSGSLAGNIVLLVDSAPRASPDAVSPWAGIAGAPLWVDGQIVGIINRSDESDRLIATRVDRLLHDEGFRSIALTRSLPPSPGADITGERLRTTDASPSDRGREREYVRWITDEPVGSEGDALGRGGVARALEMQLRTLIRDSPGGSFLVHIDGPWGAGKSTLLKIMCDLVAAEEKEKAVDGDAPWLVVHYDAWRQSRVGPPWMTLLQSLRGAVHRDKRHGWQRLFLGVHERARLVSAWQWVATGFAVVVAVGFTLALLLTQQQWGLSQWGDVGRLSAGLVPVVTALWLLASNLGRFASLNSRRSARVFLESRTDPMEELASHFDWLLSRPDRPVLVIVEDLDRCPEAFVVDLLDSVQKLLRDRSVHNVGDHDSDTQTSIVILVAADGRWISGSYDNTYQSLAHTVAEPGASVGTLFLEKLFQLSFPVPRLSGQLQAEYLSALLRDPAASPLAPAPADRGLAQRVSDAASPKVALEALAAAPLPDRLRAADAAIDRLVLRADAQLETSHVLESFASLLDPRPRGMKRFIMTYSMLRAVRTAEGSVVGVGPLALWTILLTRWPRLAQFLQAQPQAVNLFASYNSGGPVTIPLDLESLFREPPADLRSVMNHPDGPLNETNIRHCCGELLQEAR
jgi:KAP family P-loop domain